MSSKRVVVIGGGPAGLLAAGAAAEHGATAVILEKGPKPTRKLRITGKGRCNITNTADIGEFVEAFAPNGKFLYSAFSQFFRDDILDILHTMGVETKEERGGRVFPVSDKAADVADALEQWAANLGAQTKTATNAKRIIVEDGRATGVEVFGGTIKADAVVVATGGASYPKTGSTGDGYAIAREIGHTIIRPRPALSAIVCRESWVRDVQGLSLKNVQATLIDGNGRKVACEFGEMLFTHFGVSGPIILTLSRRIPALLERGNAFISIDLKPALNEEQLHKRFIRDFAKSMHFGNYLRELLPRSLAEAFPARCGIGAEKPVNKITAEERRKLVETLKDLRVEAIRMSPLDEAIVTAGGIAIGEINPGTMESKLVRGVYFAGEALDIDAETGGFNLQAAFSTGYVAGKNAAISA